MSGPCQPTDTPGRFTRRLPDCTIVGELKGDTYDTAPAGALMPWRRGTTPHPGWEWAADLAEYDALVWLESGAFGWIRRL